MKKKEDKWTRVGSYLFGLEKAGGVNRLVLKSVSGDWRVMWDESNMMFASLGSLVSDERCHKYVEALATLFYAATNYVHDATAIIEKQETPLINGFAALIKEQADFEASLVREPSKEKDDEVLQDVVDMENIKEEIEKLDEEDGNT